MSLPSTLEDLPRLRRVRAAALVTVQHLVGEHTPGVSHARDWLHPSIRASVQRWLAPVRLGSPSPASIALEAEPLSMENEKLGTDPPYSPDPVSIVIPVHNGARYTRLCLDAVRAFTHGMDHEVVVVDDASTDGTAELLARLRSEWNALRVVRHNINHGFPRAVNSGVREARGAFVVILNNDTVVTPGWLNALIAPLASDARVGLTGPRTNDSGDVATVPARYSSLRGLLNHARRMRTADRREVRKLSLFCAAVRRDDLEALGGLDEGYGLGMFEDDDLCMALSGRAKSVVLVNAYVHHFGGASFRRLPAREYIERFEINRYRFECKWNTRWQLGL